MTEFKPGDRVRYLGQIQRNYGEPERPVGTLGTVATSYIFPDGLSRNGDALFIEWDGEYENASTYTANVELVDPDTEPAEPADEATQSLRERLLDKAIKAYDFGDDDNRAASIVATAKAFEAYVTGGTK